MYRELRYLDTCASDYFQGYGGHVYAVPVAHGDTYRDILDGLMGAVRDEEIYGFEDNYAKIENDVRAFKQHARETGKLDSVWIDIEECVEDCFAYFAVVMED